MDEHTEADKAREVETGAEPGRSMSGVGVPSDRHSIDGLGYTGNDTLEPGRDKHVRPDDVGGVEDRSAG